MQPVHTVRSARYRPYTRRLAEHAVLRGESTGLVVEIDRPRTPLLRAHWHDATAPHTRTLVPSCWVLRNAILAPHCTHLCVTLSEVTLRYGSVFDVAYRVSCACRAACNWTELSQKVESEGWRVIVARTRYHVSQVSAGGHPRGHVLV